MLDEIHRRHQEAGQLGEQEQIDFDALTDQEHNKYNELRLLTRFNTFDLDYVIGWVLTAEGDHLGALARLRRAAQVEHRGCSRRLNSPDGAVRRPCLSNARRVLLTIVEVFIP